MAQDRQDTSRGIQGGCPPWIWEKLEGSRDGAFPALIPWVRHRQKLEREQKVEGNKGIHSTCLGSIPALSTSQTCQGRFCHYSFPGSVFLFNPSASIIEGMLHIPKPWWGWFQSPSGVRAGMSLGRETKNSLSPKKSRENKPKWIKKAPAPSLICSHLFQGIFALLKGRTRLENQGFGLMPGIPCCCFVSGQPRKRGTFPGGKGGMDPPSLRGSFSWLEKFPSYPSGCRT